MFKELMCPKCEESLLAIINAMCEGYAVYEIICDESGIPADYRFLEVNEAFENMIGLDRGDIIGKTVRDIYPGADISWIDAYGKVALTGEPAQFEQYYALSDKYFKVSVFTPRKGKFITLFSDITELKKSEDMLKKHKLLFECARDAVLYVKSDGTVVDSNEAASRLYGYTYEEFLNLSIHNIRHCSMRPRFESQMKEADDYGIIFESVHVKKHGSEFPVEVSAKGTKIGEEWIRIHIIRDITERKISEERILYLANHDELTGIPNRAHLMNELDRILENADRDNYKFALMLFDIDKFKSINDKYGHNAGDTVLITVASRVQKIIRKVDTLGRLGGDEFVVIQPMVRNEESVLKLVGRIFKALETPIPINGTKLTVSISIGISMYPDSTISKSDILNNTDSAMYAAKKENGNSCRFFNTHRSAAVE